MPPYLKRWKGPRAVKTHDMREMHMDIVNWIVVIGLMNVLVGLIWFLQVKDKKGMDRNRSEKS